MREVNIRLDESYASEKEDFFKTLLIFVEANSN